MQSSFGAVEWHSLPDGCSEFRICIYYLFIYLLAAEICFCFISSPSSWFSLCSASSSSVSQLPPTFSKIRCADESELAEEATLSVQQADLSTSVFRKKWWGITESSNWNVNTEHDQYQGCGLSWVFVFLLSPISLISFQPPACRNGSTG